MMGMKFFAIFVLPLLISTTPALAQKPDFISIKYQSERPLFYSKSTGYFWSIGIVTFMDGGDNNPIKHLFKASYGPKLYNEEFLRIREHGFNTLGGWSNLEHLQNRLPYGVVLFDDPDHPLKWPLKDYDGSPPPVADSDLPCPIGDPYDDDYVKALDAYLRKYVSPHKGNTKLLTYWVGAEFGLGDSNAIDFSKFIFSKGVQKRFRGWLSDKYSSIEDLNKAWGKKFSNFSESAATKPISSGRYQSDVADFSVVMLHDWLKLVVNTIRKYDPNHLIASPKISVWDFPPSLEKAFELRHFESFQGLFDLIAVDWYSKEPTHKTEGYKDLEKLHQLLKIPILNSEFGIRQQIEGWSNTPGAKTLVKTQQERADRYRSQILAMFENPMFIGAHWFRWQDHLSKKHQFNKGIIKVEGGKIVPYPELMNSMKQAHQEIQTRIEKYNEDGTKK